MNIISRNTQGVRLMRVEAGTRVVSVEIVPHSDEVEAAEVPQDGAEPASAIPETETPKENE